MKDSNNYKKYVFFFLIGLLLGFAIYALIAILSTSSFSLSSVSVIPIPAPISVQTVFSPEEGYEIIGLIDSAKESIDIEMYVFTSDEIADALKRAHDRGVKIRLILEKRVATEENPKNYNELTAYGIEVKWASRNYKLTHAKFMIIDGKRILVGSHNFSNAAMNDNRETSVIIENVKTVSEFNDVFENDWEIAS